MPKPKKVAIKVERCKCSSCGQVATVEAHKPHNFCRGFQIKKPLPLMFINLRNPNKAGTWEPFTKDELEKVIDQGKAVLRNIAQA